MQTVVRDLLTSSYRTINVLATGEDMTADMGQDGLEMLNEILEMLNGTQSQVYSIQPIRFPITVAKGAYTLGPGGDWDTARPLGIDRMVFITEANDWPMRELHDQEWQDISPKTLQSSISSGWHDDRAFPLRTINLFPVPSFANRFVDIYRWIELTSAADLDTIIDFPPLYRRFVRYYTAISLAPEYEQPVSADLNRMFLDVKARVQRLNVRIDPLRVDFALIWPRTTRGWVSDILRGVR